MSDFYDVAVIGLGAMGWGAAMSLVREGYNVHGVDIVAETLDRFGEEKGKPCKTPAEAAAVSPVVMVLVVNDSQTEDVLFGVHGAAAAAEPGTVFILSNTIAPSTVVSVHERLQQAGMELLDAPVAGGAARALRGDLTVMVAGSTRVFKAVEPVFDAVAARVYRLGDKPGQATRIKMLNQLLSDVHIAATAEAMTLAAKIGVDLETMYDVIRGTTGNSWMFEERGSHIVNGDYAPRSVMNTIVKDLRIVSREARSSGARVPLAAAALTLFAEAAEAGYGKQSGAAVARYLGKQTGAMMPGDDN